MHQNNRLPDQAVQKDKPDNQLQITKKSPRPGDKVGGRVGVDTNKAEPPRRPTFFPFHACRFTTACSALSLRMPCL